MHILFQTLLVELFFCVITFDVEAEIGACYFLALLFYYLLQVRHSGGIGGSGISGFRNSFSRKKHFWDFVDSFFNRAVGNAYINGNAWNCNNPRQKISGNFLELQRIFLRNFSRDSYYSITNGLFEALLITKCVIFSHPLKFAPSDHPVEKMTDL